MVQGPLRLSPELRTPPLPATHVRSGDRATNTYPGYVIDNTADLHSTRHLHMRPRVAPPRKCLPARNHGLSTSLIIPCRTGTFANPSNVSRQVSRKIQARSVGR